MPNRHPGTAALVLTLCTLLLGACVFNTREVVDLGEVTTPAGTTAAAVRSAFVTAGFNRGWTITDAGTGKLQGTLSKTDVYAAKIDIDYSATSYRIRLAETEGLRQEEGRVHYRVNRWIRILSADVQKALSATR